MQVKYGLSCMRAYIGDEAVAIFQLALVGDLFSDGKDLSQDRTIVWLNVAHRGDMTRGNDQEMYGGLRMNIFKGDDMIILVHNFARYLARDNFTEEAILHQAY
jgi:hypothetical protein